MQLDRRRFIALAAASAPALPTATLAAPAPTSSLGIDAAQFGLRAGSTGDQSCQLQRAINETARSRAPLAIAPGVYRAGNLALPAGAHIIGVRGGTRIVLSEGSALVTATGALTADARRSHSRRRRPAPARATRT